MTGAANVLFSELPSKIKVYNDLNSDVVNFFRVLREREEGLLRAIQDIGGPHTNNADSWRFQADDARCNIS